MDETVTTEGIDPGILAAFTSDPNEDISLTVIAHRGGGGHFGSSGVHVVDTMSTEIRGNRRTMTEGERNELHEAARTIARILVAIRQ